MEESLPTTGAELMLEEEDEEDPIDARACWMAGCREAITSPTTSLTCGAAWAAVAIKARRSLGLIILPVLFN